MRSNESQRQDVLHSLRVGKPNARKRMELWSMTGMSDREMRQAVADLRRIGYPICNDQDGEGYYLSAEPEQITSQIKQIDSRIKALAIAKRGLKKYLKNPKYRQERLEI